MPAHAARTLLALALVGVVTTSLAAEAPPVFHPAYLDLPPPTTPVPDWAFSRDPPETADLQRRDDDDVPRRIAGSSVELTRRHVIDHYDVADWHPSDHPPAPDIVMHGRRPMPTACGFCHLPNGLGLPENAPLAGLPVNYFIRQVHAFQEGSRRTVDLRMASFHGMAEVIAPKIEDAELRIAAEYYSRLRIAKPYITVIETDTVPKTHSVQYTMLPIADGGTEPIGMRIIETPKDPERFFLLDSEVGYLAYVPRGSIRRGKVLVTTGGHARTVACVTCHGTDLRGAGDVPPIAGRSPSNLVRQLYDVKFGARSGTEIERMKPVVKDLTDADIVDIAAYVVSRHP